MGVLPRSAKRRPKTLQTGRRPKKGPVWAFRPDQLLRTGGRSRQSHSAWPGHLAQAVQKLRGCFLYSWEHRFWRWKETDTQLHQKCPKDMQRPRRFARAIHQFHQRQEPAEDIADESPTKARSGRFAQINYVTLWGMGHWGPP